MVQQTTLTLSGGQRFGLDSAQQLEKRRWFYNVALASGGPTWRPWLGTQPCAGSGEVRCQAGAAPPSRGLPAGQRPLLLAVHAPPHPPCQLFPCRPPHACCRLGPLSLQGQGCFLSGLLHPGRSSCCFLWAGMLRPSSCALSCCCPCVHRPGSVRPGQRLTIWLVPELGSDGCPDGTGLSAEFQEPAF